MGFFSGDSKVYVSSVIYPLGEEPDRIPDVVQAGVIAAGMQGASIPSAINRAIFDGMGVKLTQGYHYAKNHYYAGLPTGFPTVLSGKSDAQLTLLVKEYFEGLYPSPANTVDIKTVTVTYGTNYDVILRQLIEVDYSYDFYEEEVHTANHGVAVGAVLEYDVLPDDDLLHASQDGFRLTFTNPDTSTVIIDVWYAESLFAAHAAVESRVVFECALNGAPAKTHYYVFGGSDARLNIFLRALATPVSGTFPAIVLKKALSSKKGVYLDDDLFTGTSWQTGDAYKTSKAYAERMDVNIDDILSTLKDNVDQKKIDYAFIQPGTMLNSPNTAVHEYHFRYFQRLFTSFPDNKPAYDEWVAEHGNQTTRKSKAEGCPAQGIHILDPNSTNNSVNMIIAWRYITYEEKVGALTKAYEVECGTQEFMNSNYSGSKALKQVEFDVTKMYFRKRLTSTTYAEIMVCGLWHENYVYKLKHVQSSAWAAFNDPDGDFGSGFILPLEYEVLVGLSGRERLQLGQEALHLVLNCYKIVKEKWYETGIFKVILAIVAIVVVVLSWGTLTAAVSGIWSAVGTVVGAALGTAVSLTVIMAVSAVITALIVTTFVVGVTWVAKEAGAWAAEQWGPAWGAIVQIAATIALSYAAFAGFNSLTGMTPAPVGLVQSSVNAASYLFSGLSAYTEFGFEELREKQSAWNDYITSPTNPQEELNKLFQEMFPDLGAIQEAVFFAPRERMDEFLGRTLTLVDGLTNRLTLPISHLSEITLTPRLV